MAQLKWDVDGKGETPNRGGYEWPDLVKGSYVVRVKRMTVGKITGETSKNKGKPRITVLMEVVGGAGANGLDDPEYQYLGHPIWDGFNIIASGAGYVNAFLHGLTDGSEEQKRAIEAAFWPPNGPYAKQETSQTGKVATHVKRIGGYKIGSPDGKLLLQVVVKPDKDLKGNFKATVSQYMPYKGGNKPESSDDLDNLDDVDDGLADATDSIESDGDLSEEDFAEVGDKDFF